MNASAHSAETTVAVLMGGWSAEREVSLSSGEACAGALRARRLQGRPDRRDSARRIVSILQDLKPDVAFNALHGKWGEDGCCAAILETLQIPYTHSGVLASSLAMHKEKSKAIFRAAGVPVAESKLVRLEDVATQHPMAPALCGEAGGRRLERRRPHRARVPPTARRAIVLDSANLRLPMPWSSASFPARN